MPTAKGSVRKPKKNARNRTLSEQSQKGRKSAVEVSSVHYKIKESVSKHELSTLEPFRQIFSNGLTDHTRTGEADQSAGLSDVEITEHGVRSGNATRSWISKQ